jgi:ATP-dependent RNA helicase DHX8/PRP22
MGKTLSGLLSRAAVLQGYLETMGLPLGAPNNSDDSHEALRQSLVAGLFLNAARRQPDGRFRVLSSGQEVHMHPSSTLQGRRPKCIVFNEVVLTTKLYAHVASAVDAAWLPQLVPRFYASDAVGGGTGAGRRE